jgi:hypothetical protein
MEKTISLFKSGVHNLLDDEVIPVDAASNSSNWYTNNGRIKLIPGKELLGASGGAGMITGEIFGYKVDGSKIHWRKRGTVIQYLNGSTWINVVTGLTANADYAFANYSSLAGTFTYAFGVDGIYKMHNANPASFNSMFNSAKNFKGKAIIDKGRTLLWGTIGNKTNLYGSYKDNQDTAVYTAVASEATTSLTGTLAFKASGLTRNCFSLQITITASGEVYTDTKLGTMIGSLGGTGTINYMTGVYTLSNAGVGIANYSWEDSNRLPGEGFRQPQDLGGDAILNVLVGADEAYYSMKEQSVYRLSISSDDTTVNNSVYRTELGIPSYRSAKSMQLGIIFMDTAKYELPQLTLLEKNPIGGQITPRILFTHFKFANYVYDDCTIDTYDRYILVACKSKDATFNDTILLCDVENKTVDATAYAGRTFAKNGGDLFMGSSITENVYKLFSGFDDDQNAIENFWTGKAELFNSNNLKKYRFIRLKGNISVNQSYEVYVNYDNSNPQLVGTVVGSGTYVDYSLPQTIGSNIIGTSQIGGDNTSITYSYLMQINLKKVPKFRKRQITYKAISIGYVDIESHTDLNIEKYEGKIPSRFREKQNISLNGLVSNMPNPQY